MCAAISSFLRRWLLQRDLPQPRVLVQRRWGGKLSVGILSKCRLLFPIWDLQMLLGPFLPIARQETELLKTVQPAIP